MNKTKNTRRVYISDLNANDVFSLPGDNTRYVVISRRTSGSVTRVEYRLMGSTINASFTRVNLSTADLYTD